jgi:hypothetical protein
MTKDDILELEMGEVIPYLKDQEKTLNRRNRDFVLPTKNQEYSIEIQRSPYDRRLIFRTIAENIEWFVYRGKSYGDINLNLGLAKGTILHELFYKINRESLEDAKYVGGTYNKLITLPTVEGPLIRINGCH